MNHRIRTASRHMLLAGSAAIILLTALPVSAAPRTLAKRQQQQKQQKARPITVVLDHMPLKLSAPPILQDGNLMFPAKAFFDAAGVHMQLVKGTISAVKGTVRVGGKLNSAKAVKGKQTFVLPAAPVIMDGRLYVPAKFCALVLDKQVIYDKANQIARIGFSLQQMHQFQVSLFEAARSGNTQVIQTMIDRGVDVNEKLLNVYLDNTALDYAILNNHTEAAKLLLANKGTYSIFRIWPVLEARNAELMKLLLDYGLDSNRKMPNTNNTLLETASQSIYSMGPDGTETVIPPSVDIVNTLLEHGADPSEDLSLSFAVDSFSFDIVQTLIAHGADPYQTDQYGTSAYQRATINGIEKWLIPASANTLPTLTLQTADGTAVREGSLSYVLADNPNLLRKNARWRTSTIYLDTENESYRLRDVQVFGASYVLPKEAVFKVENGLVIPAVFKLPAFNVQGQLGQKEEQLGGLVTLLDNNNNLVTSVEANKGTFKLYLPPGDYHFGEYRAYNSSVPYTIDPSTFTVTEGGALLHVSTQIQLTQ